MLIKYEYLRTGEALGKCLSLKDRKTVKEVRDAEWIKRINGGQKGGDYCSM